MTTRRITRRTAAFALSATLLLGGLAGCSGEGYDTSCGLDQCTVTFDRGANATASVLGIEAKLIEVQGEQATFEVAGEQISLTVGQAATEVAGLNVSLSSLTDTQAAIQIARAG